MTIPEDIVHVTYGFALGSPEQDIALFGHYLRLNHVGGTPYIWTTELPALATDLAPKFNTFWDGVAGLYGSDVHPQFVKCTHLDTAGHAIDVASHGLDTGGGSAGGATLPYEVSVAVTLYGYDPGTYVPDSRRRRNRFYLPPMSVGVVGANGRLTSGAMSTLSTAVDAWMEDVQGIHTGPSGASHFDVVTLSAVGAGRADQVFAMGIGDVFDSQRRRRNNQAEARTYSTLSSS